MKSLDDIYRKMEEERLERMRVQKEAELQQIALYEKQRQYMEQQRRMYEKVGTVAPSSAASNSSSAGAAGAGGGGQVPIPPYTTFNVNISVSQWDTFSVQYTPLDDSIKYVIDFGDGTIVKKDGDEYAFLTHEYKTTGDYVVKIPNVAEKLTLGAPFGFNFPSGIFADSTGLTDLNLNSTITTIEPGVFENGGVLKNLTISGSKITTIKNGVFNNFATNGVIKIANNGVYISSIEAGAFLFGNRKMTVNFGNYITSAACDSLITDLYNNNVENLTLMYIKAKVDPSLQYMINYLNDPVNNLNNDIR